jgi:glyoxylase-like metal-dependent hydrolase (beta-lactamase superfamily II)
MSHFHFDHDQNIGEFDRIAFPDLPDLRERTSADGEFHITSAELFYGDYPAAVTVDEWLPLETDIDLGGTRIRLVHLPGHSDESVAIVNTESRYVLLGDFLYNGSLFLFSDSDLAVYKRSVDHLLTLITPDFRLFGAHGEPEVDFDRLRALRDFLRCIDDGTCRHAEKTVWGEPAHVYDAMDMRIVVFQE